MKNVLLVGDSTRQGYDLAVKKSLEGIANVYFPNENCRFASYVLRHLNEYGNLIENGEVDVLHWNAGLWDCLRMYEEEPQTPIDIYAYYIERICKRIKRLYPNAKVIFATSTMVMSEKLHKNFMRYNEETAEYNKVAVEICKKYGFEINDLYTLSIPMNNEEYHSDACHYYTPIATEAFTKQVLKHLAKALEIDGEIEYKEQLYTDKPVGI